MKLDKAHSYDDGKRGYGKQGGGRDYRGDEGQRRDRKDRPYKDKKKFHKEEPS